MCKAVQVYEGGGVRILPPKPPAQIKDEGRIHIVVDGWKVRFSYKVEEEITFVNSYCKWWITMDWTHGRSTAGYMTKPEMNEQELRELILKNVGENIQKHIEHARQFRKKRL